MWGVQATQRSIHDNRSIFTQRQRNMPCPSLTLAKPPTRATPPPNPAPNFNLIFNPHISYSNPKPKNSYSNLIIKLQTANFVFKPQTKNLPSTLTHAPPHRSALQQAPPPSGGGRPLWAYPASAIFHVSPSEQSGHLTRQNHTRFVEMRVGVDGE